LPAPLRLVSCFSAGAAVEPPTATAATSATASASMSALFMMIRPSPLRLRDVRSRSSACDASFPPGKMRMGFSVVTERLRPGERPWSVRGVGELVELPGDDERRLLADVDGVVADPLDA